MVTIGVLFFLAVFGMAFWILIFLSSAIGGAIFLWIKEQISPTPEAEEEAPAEV